MYQQPLRRGVGSTVVIALLLGGCGAGRESRGEPAICLQGEPFVASDRIPVGATGRGDATLVTDIRWAPHEGCERVVIDLASGTAMPAASAGAVQADVLRDLGVVRIALRDVERVATDATNRTFDGSLARAAYAVWAPEGRWVYIDIHLADAAEVHVARLGDPARVVIDLRPGGGPIPRAAAAGTRAVVLSPRPGAARYPLTITGYARTFEANVVARFEQNGQEVLETFTTATAWVDAWGHYAMAIDDGPAGPVTLHVGEYSARDGTWEGVEVPLDMQR